MEKAQKTKRSAVARRPRHTPRSRRPNCVAVRANLDPWYYPTLESFEAALRDGTVRREFAVRDRADSEAAAKDSLL